MNEKIMMRRYTLYIWMLISALLSVTSCADNDFYPKEDEFVSLTYTVGLDNDIQGRAIGDGSPVNTLYVGIYEDGKEVKRIKVENENIATQTVDVEISLLKGHTYDLVFWAQSNQTKVYDITNLKNVVQTITYPESMTLQEASNMDAFFLLKEDVTANNLKENGGNLTLARPFALLSVADTNSNAPGNIKKTILKITYGNEEPMTLTYTDFTVESYCYLAAAFLKPGAITANVTLLDENDSEIKNVSVDIDMKVNNRYNVIGNMQK